MTSIQPRAQQVSRLASLYHTDWTDYGALPRAPVLSPHGRATDGSNMRAGDSRRLLILLICLDRGFAGEVSGDALDRGRVCQRRERHDHGDDGAGVRVERVDAGRLDRRAFTDFGSG